LEFLNFEEKKLQKKWFFLFFGVSSYQKLGLTSDEVSGYHELGLPPW
jgi:hypothetical protein